jgi:HK97 gp10 family phage protein
VKFSVDIDQRALQNLTRGFKDLEEKAQDRIIRNAARAAASEVKRKVKSNAPKGDKQSVNSQIYGRLRNNITIKSIRKVPYFRVTVGDAFWGLFLESGTGKFNIAPGGRAKGASARTHIRATKWFSKSVDTSRKSIEQAMVNNIRRSLEREFARITK